MNELQFTSQETVDDVGQVPGLRFHPRLVRLMGNACVLDASRLQIDDEKHEIAHQAMQRETLDAEEARGRDCLV